MNISTAPAALAHSSRVLDTLVSKLTETYRGWIWCGLSADDAMARTLAKSTAGPATIAAFRAAVAS